MMFARHTSRARAVAEVSDLGQVRTRSAFTLIELLVVVVIIGILAGMAMAVMFTAQEAARRSRTEGLISVLDSQMAYRFDSYRTRRIQTSVAYKDYLKLLNASYAPEQPDIQRLAAMQLIARRQLMRIELPDRWWDVAFDDSTWDSSLFDKADQPPISSTIGTVSPKPIYNGVELGIKDVNLNPILRFPNDLTNSLDPNKRTPPFPLPAPVLPGTPPIPDDPTHLLNPIPDPFAEVERILPSWVNRSSLAIAYLQRYQQVLRQRGNPPSIEFQGSECLYMILTTGMGDETSGGGTFNEQDFADTDGDGMPEFIDGWGRPIGFLRWAPGFRSDIQTGDPIKDHDPFDARRVDPIAFRLYPLIISSGPDGVIDDGVNTPIGIESHSKPGDSDKEDSTPNIDFENVNFNDPYAPMPLAANVRYADGSLVAPLGFIFRGERFKEHAGIGPNDNIFNHSLQVR